LLDQPLAVLAYLDPQAEVLAAEVAYRPPRAATARTKLLKTLPTCRVTHARAAISGYLGLVGRALMYAARGTAEVPGAQPGQWVRARASESPYWQTVREPLLG
jgi:hypothetical protein